MQGSEVDELFDLVLDVFGDEVGLGEVHAALDDAVTDGGDLVQRVDDLGLAAGEDLLDLIEGRGMVRQDDVEVDLDAGIGLCFDVAVDGDALAKAFGDDFFVRHIDELIFQGRRAGVDDEDLHGVSPLKHFQISYSLRIATIIKQIAKFFHVDYNRIERFP